MEKNRNQDTRRGAAGEQFYRRVRHFVREHDMIHSGEAVIAGVSGGADSLCLFQVLLRLSRETGFVLEVVHVHHGLRAAAEEDLRFVEELCRKEEIPCTSVRVDAAAMAERWGTGVEEAGRRLRYEAFAERALELESRRQAPCRIAVAHHREDQAETVLFHLCRGTGLRGAGGMRPVQGRIIRPLLSESRESIERSLTEGGFTWRTDETNADLSYTRNYLRSEILPRLAEGVNTAAAERIARFAEVCADAERYLAKMTQEAIGRCAVPAAETPNAIGALRIPPLLQEDPYIRGRILYRYAAEASGTRRDLQAVHIEALQKLCAGGSDGQLSMPGRITAVRSADRLFFVDTEKAGHTALHAGLFPASAEDYVCRVLPFDGDLSTIPQNQYTKWFDYDKIGTFPVFRTRQPGDRMSLRGQAGENGKKSLTGGRQESLTGQSGVLLSKKLARIMLDSKVPAAVRDRIVLPYIGEEALWIPGVRMGDRWKVSRRTKRVLAITVHVQETPAAAEEPAQDTPGAVAEPAQKAPGAAVGRE